MKHPKQYLRIVLFCVIGLYVCTNRTLAQSGYVGESIYLSAPSTPGTIDGASWSSSNPNYVMVSGDHYGATASINAYFSGTVTITLTYAYSYYLGGQKQYSSTQHAYYYISCRSSTVTLDKREVTIKVGEKVTLTYTNSSGYNLYFVSWETSDKTIADFEGRERVDGAKSVTITGNDEGECVITCDGKTGNTAPTCKVKVTATPPTSIEIKPDNLTLKVGEKKSLSYTLTPSDAYTKVTWSSSNDNVATVNSSGLVRAINGGSAVITVTTGNGLSSKATVEVLPLPDQISLADQQIFNGYSKQLIPILTPSNATCTYTWESTDPRIASVDKTGRVRGLKVGSTDIKLTTENGKTATCRLTVRTPSDGMEYNNVQLRTSVLKSLIKKSLNNLK